VKALQLARDVAAGRRGTLPLIVAIWFLLVLGVAWRPWLPMNPDTSYYMALSRSIAQGQGYAMHGVPHRGYPPLFPLLLAAVHSPARTSFRPEKLLMVAGSLGALLAVYWLVSQRFSGGRRLVLMLLFAYAPAYLAFSGQLLTEMPFLCFAATFMAAANAYWRRETPSWRLAAAAMVALAASAMTRSVGAAFYAACAAWMVRPSLWRRARRKLVPFALLFALVALPPVVGWGLWATSGGTSTSGTYAGYLRYQYLGGHPALSREGFPRLLALLARTVPKQLVFCGRAVDAGLAGGSSTVLPLLVVAVAFVGLLRRLRGAEPQEYCFLAFFLLTVFWPWAHGYRLWVPALPPMLMYLADGLEWFARAGSRLARLSDTWRRRVCLVVPGLAALALFLASLKSDYRIVKRFWDPRPRPVNGVVFGGDRAALAEFLAQQGSPGMLVAHVKDLEFVPAFHDPAGPRVVGIPRVRLDAPQATLDAWRARGITHLAILPKPWRPHKHFAEDAARKLVAAVPEAFRLVKDMRILKVYELVYPPAGGPALNDNGSEPTARLRAATWRQTRQRAATSQVRPAPATQRAAGAARETRRT